MRRSLVALVVLLAGCGDPSPLTDESSAPHEPSIAATSFTFYGWLQGAGYGTDVTGGLYFGSYAPIEEFPVDAGAQRVLFDLTWTTAAPHGIVYLFFTDPEGSPSYIQPTADELLARHLVHEVDMPVPGIWAVSARSNGASVDVEYTVVVTLTWNPGLSGST